MTTIVDPVEPVTEQDQRTFCAVHTTVETTLRCNKCGRYMCTRCAVQTPVGYRCKECVHQQQDVYFTATQRDYAIAGIVALALAVPIGFVVPRLFVILVIILSLPIGGFIGQIVHRAIGKRRGRYIWAVVTGAIVVGTLIPLLPSLTLLFSALSALSPAVLLYFLPSLIYVVLCAGGASALLRYGK
ncbi:MAG: hypothetical protein ABI947_07705 [Chloroflexota bacterium]